MAKIKLIIDDRPVEVDEGKTVLEAAREAGISIPTVCDHEDLTPFGACRMCIVEIEGVRGYPTSCTTPAAPGMVVKTQTAELVKLRGRVLELMLSGHPNACLVCDHRALCEQYRTRSTKAGATTRCGFCSNRESCSIREMAFSMPIRDLDLPVIYSALKLEKDDPFMDRDYNLCILCGRCTRICEKIHGAPAISIVRRGRWAKIGTSFEKSHVFSGCTFCGSCIDICPTGALTDRYAKWYGEPDAETLSTCLLCPEGCAIRVLRKGSRIIANRMKDFTHESRLCAMGRFAYAQIVNAPDRLRRALIKENGVQIPADFAAAVAALAAKLKDYRGSFVAIVNESATREEKYLYQKFAQEVMKGRIAYVPAGGGFAELHPSDAREGLQAGKFKAVLVTGDFLDLDLIEKVLYLAVADFLPSAAAAAADVLLPVAVLSEVEGTFRNADGDIKALEAATPAPGDSQPEWLILRDLAQAMGETSFAYANVHEVTPEVEHDAAPAKFAGTPRNNLGNLPARYRGHYVADSVCALEAVGLPMSPPPPLPDSAGEGFPVIEKKEVVPNFHLVKIRCEQVARFAQPGQFVIMMVKETSERVPFTLVDWDAAAGTITLVVEEVGRSSREVALLQAGDKVAHVSGPLGMPLVIEKKGTVVLGGGCYGIGSIYPIAKAMKAAGNKVIAVIEAASHYLFYMEDELRSVCDEVIIATKDGSRGMKGGVQDVFVKLIEDGMRVDQFVAIGCTFMMKLASDATKPYGIPTWVALNPIMVDGTGMCGACRLSVGGATRFACVDGPMFNGHEVDWDELFSRRSAYVQEEIEALPQGARVLEVQKQLTGPSCGCGRQ